MFVYFFLPRQNIEEIWIRLHFYLLFRVLRITTRINILSADTVVGTSSGTSHAGANVRALLHNNSSIRERSRTPWDISHCSRDRGWNGRWIW